MNARIALTLTTVLALHGGLAAPARALNPGPPTLERALDSVGENLFGDAIFGASETTVPDGAGNVLPAVQLDLQHGSAIPAIFDVFAQPGPPNLPQCRTFFQLEIGAAGVLLRADPEALPEGFDPVVEFVSLVGFPPNPIVEGGDGVEASINEGLVQALGSVGGNLFGEASFGAGLTTVDDGAGNALPAVQLDLDHATAIPAIFDVFSNPGPPDAPTYFQVEVGPAGIFLRADPEALPEGFDPVVEFTSLLFSVPSLCAGETEQ